MNIMDLATTDGIVLHKASGKDGGEYHGPCPGCGGTDRFHVWMEQNDGEGSFWCRQCGKSGDGIQYLMDFHGKTYREACAALDKEAKSTPRPLAPAHQGQRTKPSWEPKAVDSPVDKWREKAENFVSYCHDALLKSPEQVRYLEGRGLSLETIAQARLGWNVESRWRPREAWGLPAVTKENGKSKKLWMPVGLVIPWFDGSGAVIRVRVRLAEPREQNMPKYYMLPGSSSAPMFLGPERDAFVLIESELDGLLVFQAAGDIIGVCALGSASNRPDISMAAVLQKALCILNSLDFDQAGSKEQDFWSANFPQTARWPVPKGKDPGEAIQAGVNLREWILSGLPPRWRIKAGIKKEVPARKPEEKPKEAPEEPSEMELGAPTEILGGLASKIRELAAMMQGHPVFVLRYGSNIGIRKPDEWGDKNWDLYGRISQLIFSDLMVFHWLCSLPQGKYYSSALMDLSAKA